MPRLSLLLCLALTAALSAQLRFGTLQHMLTEDVTAPVEPQVMPDPIPQFALAPLAALGESIARPLFDSTRRPPKPAPAPVVVPPPPAPPPPKPRAPNVGKFVLSAVVITKGQKREAIILNPKTGKQERVAEGGTVAEWTLKRVRDDGVTLAWNNETQDVPLRTFKAPPKPRPPSAKANAARQKAAQTVQARKQPSPVRRQLTAAQRKRLEELRQRRRERRAELLRQRQAQQRNR